MKRKNGWTRQWPLLTAGAVCLAFAMSGIAQVQTQTATSSGQAATQVNVERGQVVYVNGNDLVVKMDDGTMRHFANVPDSTRVDVDGKMLGIHDLKPGMTLQRTITTTTTPKVVTTTKTVSGKVWHVTPPTSVILTLDDGTNQEFKIPKNQQFEVNGQMTNAWGLKKGMKISATEVVEEPITQVQREAKLTGTMPPPPPPPAPDVPILVVVAAPTPPPAAPAVAAATPPPALPKTGSELPLFGLLGGLSLLLGLGLKAVRRAL
jgi:LPXTG-motif cell wall-anchored protein